MSLMERYFLHSEMVQCGKLNFWIDEIRSYEKGLIPKSVFRYRRILLLFFRERGREGEEEGERNINVREKLACALTVNQTLNPGVCPDWESNPWPFGLQDNAPTNWATLARAQQKKKKLSFVNMSFLKKVYCIESTLVMAFIVIKELVSSSGPLRHSVLFLPVFARY